MASVNGWKPLPQLYSSSGCHESSDQSNNNEKSAQAAHQQRRSPSPSVILHAEHPSLFRPSTPNRLKDLDEDRVATVIHPTRASLRSSAESPLQLVAFVEQALLIVHAAQDAGFVEQLETYLAKRGLNGITGKKESTEDVNEKYERLPAFAFVFSRAFFKDATCLQRFKQVIRRMDTRKDVKQLLICKVEECEVPRSVSYLVSGMPEPLNFLSGIDNDAKLELIATTMASLIGRSLH
mmetsp:Transcript_32333/g.52234  ORF Transcript_32333/g.52234 Transcript_32333/m.52234 type:complete len:237 (+) Transcript_32333:170-880(+)|eukprot:CAMPEP_0184662888 /NCGR_PEP_ID=MMETSP0308-20130426/45453_1 /TAXON_ID=38269 /ORGANISM="Gloeochaete witrockiana, Strain SAG 46.84" /LENGTH=236 /DNA_ID=CAMNT_0027105219 /DNA_START=124 /DNA_END=834 /DNA_ORIENTATION=-